MKTMLTMMMILNTIDVIFDSFDYKLDHAILYAMQ